MYKIQINDGAELEVSNKGENYYLDNEEVSWNISKLGNGRFQIIKDHVVYNADVVEHDSKKKEIKLKLNGKLMIIKVKNELDALLSKLGMDKLQTVQIKDIKAPMPGLIIDIKVSAGQLVKKGEPILILEAMKMENVLKAPMDVDIKSIEVKKGQSVDKNQILIKF
jgi:biotin carboxyl carrier protein